MARAVLELAAFFLAPFLAYMLYLAALRRNPIAVEHWERGPFFWVTLAGLLAAIGGALLFGAAAERHSGRYVPAHMENGKVVPGQWVDP
jgi:uncharacterized membrane protein HdeD (DUF308 family)